MADAPKSCPKCHNAWGIAELRPAVPAQDGNPAKPATFRCESCYHRWSTE